MFAMCMVFCVMVSLLYEGIHTINQVIFGCCIGIGNYLLYFHVLQMHTVSVKKFLETIKKKIVIIVTVFVIAITALFLVFFFIRHDESAYKEMIDKHCQPKDMKKHKMMHYDGLMDTLTIAGPIGMVSALMITNFLINKLFYLKEKNIFDWISAELKVRIVQVISFSVIYACVYYGNTLIVDLIGNKTIPISAGKSVFESFFPQFILNSFGIVIPYVLVELILGKQPSRSEDAVLKINVTEQDSTNAPLFKKDVISETEDV